MTQKELACVNQAVEEMEKDIAALVAQEDYSGAARVHALLTRLQAGQASAEGDGRLPGGERLRLRRHGRVQSPTSNRTARRRTRRGVATVMGIVLNMTEVLIDRERTAADLHDPLQSLQVTLGCR